MSLADQQGLLEERPNVVGFGSCGKLTPLALAGGVKELGFWEVSSTTLQDVHEVAPTQEEMQAAAEGKASPEANMAEQVRPASLSHM